MHSEAGDGLSLGLRGASCWADGEAGRIELVFRPPLGTAEAGRGTRPGRGDGQAHSLPVLGGGHVSIDRRVEIGAGGATDVLMHAHVRGEEVLIVLVSVQP